MLYLTRKERCFSLVEFLRQAKDVLGTELLMQAMVSSRTVADRVRTGTLTSVHLSSCLCLFREDPLLGPSLGFADII